MPPSTFEIDAREAGRGRWGRGGITIGTAHGVAVDRRQRTSAEGVWATGDCAEVHHRITGKPAAIALGTHANKAGRVVAGINIGGGHATVRDPVLIAARRASEKGTVSRPRRQDLADHPPG